MSPRQRAPIGSPDRPSTRGRVRGYLWARLPVAIGAVALGLGVRLASPRPPERSVEGVAAILGEAMGGVVSPKEFVWEPSEGLLRDLCVGRHLLFLGAAAPGAPRDLFRARVRLSPAGRPIEVAALRNLTDTALGDEQQLVARGEHVAFATQALGVVQGVTVLDRRGAPEGSARLVARLATHTRIWLDTDSWRGFGRTEVVLGEPPAEVAIDLDDEALAIVAREPAAPPLVLRLADGHLEPAADHPLRPEAWTAPSATEPWAHATMDVARRLLGTDAADRVKSLLFHGRSGLLRWLHRAEREPAAAPLAASPQGGTPSWPPARIIPVFRHPLEGEGQWRPPAAPWLLEPLHTDGPGEPYLLETVVRPDPSLPFAVVRLVAIDTRQIDLRIEAGFEEPRPETGPRGRGRIPSPDLTPDALRVVGAFNGAFQTEHGGYGMVVDRRVLLPPRPGAATVAIDAEGRAWLGNWGSTDAVPSWVGSLRQNLDPLIDQGSFNPRARRSWGFPLEGGGILTERSALCLTRGGQLVYGWGIEVAPETLARALLAADCVHAIHLDMNPGHVGFAYLRVHPDRSEARLLTPEMSIAPRRYLEGSPKDFFFLVQRRPEPPSAIELDWRADRAVQPPPSWLAAVHRATLDRLGTRVALWAFAPDRFDWEIRPGAKELGGWTSPGALEPADHARALVAIGLGVAFRKDNRRGLVLDGVASLPVRADLGLLAIDRFSRGIAIGIAPEPVAPPGDATELPLLATGGELRIEARELGTMKMRSAGCLGGDGTLLVAMSRFESSEANARALLDLGCDLVVELDRGSQVDAFVHRAGESPAPADGYEESVLYGLSMVGRGRGRRLEDRIGERPQPSAAPATPLDAPAASSYPSSAHE